MDLNKCMGSSTDGAANMRGQYNEFTAWLKKDIPEVQVLEYGLFKLSICKDIENINKNIFKSFNIVRCRKIKKTY